MSRRKLSWSASIAALVVVVSVIVWQAGETTPAAEPPQWTVQSAPPLTPANMPGIDTSAANRRAPVAGLPDWSKAGYRQGAGLPADSDINPDPRCRISPSVTPNDSADDSDGLQEAIDRIR